MRGRAIKTRKKEKEGGCDKRESQLIEGDGSIEDRGTASGWEGARL